MTSAKIIPNGDVRMHHAKKIVENPLSNITIKNTSTIKSNPLPELCREGLRMIVLVSLVVLLRGFPTIFHMVHSITTSPGV